METLQYTVFTTFCLKIKYTPQQPVWNGGKALPQVATKVMYSVV